jgi:C-terminal processing protease CtpA/Prc
VQEVVQFNSGESLKFTIAEWLTPNGRLIQKEGVMPDIELAEQERGGRDEQMLEAIRIVKAKSR